MVWDCESHCLYGGTEHQALSGMAPGSLLELAEYNPKGRKDFLLESKGHQCQKGSAKCWNCCVLCSQLRSYLKFFLIFYFLMGKHQRPLLMTNGLDSTLSRSTTSGLQPIGPRLRVLCSETIPPLHVPGNRLFILKNRLFLLHLLCFLLCLTISPLVTPTVSASFTKSQLLRVEMPMSYLPLNCQCPELYLNINRYLPNVRWIKLNWNWPRLYDKPLSFSHLTHKQKTEWWLLFPR